MFTREVLRVTLILSQITGFPESLHHGHSVILVFFGGNSDDVIILYTSHWSEKSKIHGQDWPWSNR